MIIIKWTTVTPFKFAAIKVRGFEIITYSRPFNFVVSYQARIQGGVEPAYTPPMAEGKKKLWHLLQNDN